MTNDKANILRPIAEAMIVALQEMIASGHYGSKHDHIEEVSECNCVDPHFSHDVTTWTEESCEPRQTFALGLIDICAIVGNYAAEPAAQAVAQSLLAEEGGSDAP